jgi:hypothetical protein
MDAGALIAVVEAAGSGQFGTAVDRANEADGGQPDVIVLAMAGLCNGLAFRLAEATGRSASDVLAEAAARSIPDPVFAA